MKRFFFFPLAAVLLIAACSTAAEARPSCFGKKATIVGTAGPDTLRGTKAPDVIVSLGGRDRIYSKNSKDRVCSGAGADLVKSGPSQDKINVAGGADRVFGGAGKDTVLLGAGDDWISGDEGSDSISGGTGSDTIIGRNGGETVHAGPGNDRILAGLLDDKLYGGEGDDVFLGGHGGDFIYGEGGNDIMRGGVNYDHYSGGSGYDTISFATAMPPGPNGISGVAISDDWMSGDDLSGELRSSVERFLGSAYDDSFTTSGDFQDLCGGASCVQAAGSAVALVDTRESKDAGLLVLGDSGDDNFAIRQSGKRFFVTHQSPLAAGDGCAEQTATEMICDIPQGDVLGFVGASGGSGDDRIDLQSGIADEITVDLDSGPGNDRVSGGPGDDVIIDEGGQDRQEGEGGSDALISTTGADALFAGAGSDQLVTDSLCYAHIFDGGPGMSDIAGFARVRDRGISGGFGRGIVALGVSNCPKIDVRMSNEIFEGTNQADVMLGTSRVDYIKAREGNDILKGFAGADDLDGQEGSDRCIGGSGKDILTSCERRN